MKKIIFILLSCFLASACNVLDLKPVDKISEADTWTDQSLIQLYVNGNYNALLHGYRLDILAAATDETYCIHNWGSVYTIQKGELTSDNISNVTTNINYWKYAYGYIKDINTFFKNIETAPVDDSFKKQVIGEMKFLRAFIYANLIWRFGGVPIITKTYNLNEDYAVSRSSYDDCVKFIVDELDEATKYLPGKQPSGENGRASAHACMALKARVLLYAASPLNNPTNEKIRWQKTADAAEALINVGYSLHDDYQSIFLNDNKEIIFARFFTQSSGTEYHKWNGRNGSSGFTGQNPTQNLVNSYEMASTGKLPYIEQSNGTFVLNSESGYDPEKPYEGRDPRFYASILYDGAMWAGRETETWHGGLDSPESSISAWDASKTSYALKKFLIESLPPTGTSLLHTSPWIFFRYAEVLLNYAEAKFELGDEETAREYLNKVRSRKSVMMPPVTDSGEALRKRIQHERRIELAFEEHRFFDVRRWKIAMETESKDIWAMNINKLNNGKKTYEQIVLSKRGFLPQHYLMPIPRSEIDKSKKSLIQNIGY